MGRQFDITIEHASKFQRAFLSQARYHYFDWIKFHESFMGIHFLDVYRETVVPMALRFCMAFSSTKLSPLSGLNHTIVGQPVTVGKISFSPVGLRELCYGFHDHFVPTGQSLSFNVFGMRN